MVTMGYLKKTVWVIVVSAINVLIGIGINLLIPKLLIPAEYGYWRIFILYSSFSGIAHLGISDGLLIKYLSKNEKYAQLHFGKDFIFSVIIYGSAIILVTPFILGQASHSILTINILVQILLQNLLLTNQVFLQSQKKFILTTFFTALPNLFLLIAITILSSEISSNILIKLYNIAFIFTNFLTFSSVFKQKEIRTRQILAKPIPFLQWSYYYIKSGLPILLSGISILGIKSFDRLFISKTYELEEFGYYAFANSILTIFVTILVSTNNIFLKFINEYRSKSSLLKIEQKIYLVFTITWIGVLAIKGICFNILLKLLPDYSASIPYLDIFLLSMPLLLIIPLTQFNYFKHRNMQHIFLYNSIIILVFTIISVYSVIKFSGDLVILAKLKVLILLLWFYINEYAIFKILKITRKYIFPFYLIIATIILICSIF